MNYLTIYWCFQKEKCPFIVKSSSSNIHLILIVFFSILQFTLSFRSSTNSTIQEIDGPHRPSRRTVHNFKEWNKRKPWSAGPAVSWIVLIIVSDCPYHTHTWYFAEEEERKKSPSFFPGSEDFPYGKFLLCWTDVWWQAGLLRNIGTPIDSKCVLPISGILIVVAIGVALGVFFGGILLTLASIYMKKWVDFYFSKKVVLLTHWHTSRSTQI